MNASKKLFERFFFPLGARCDRWSKLVSVTSQWGLGSKTRAEVDDVLTDLSELETFHGYPGIETVGTLADLVESGEPARAAALATHYYRELTSNTMGQPSDAAIEADGVVSGPKSVGSEHIITRSNSAGRRSEHPYFEVLVVSATNQFQGRAISQELARLSSNRDPFSYSTSL